MRSRIKWLFGLAQLERIQQQNQILFERQEMLMAAIDNLTANIAALKAKIEAFLASVNANSESQIQTAADAVAVITNEIPSVG